MGVAIMREFEWHRLRRVAYMGVPRAVLEQDMRRERFARANPKAPKRTKGVN